MVLTNMAVPVDGEIRPTTKNMIDDIEGLSLEAMGKLQAIRRFIGGSEEKLEDIPAPECMNDEIRGIAMHLKVTLKIIDNIADLLGVN